MHVSWCTSFVVVDIGLLDLLEHRNLRARERLSAAVAVLVRSGNLACAREAITALAALAASEGSLERSARLAAAAESVYDGPRSPAEELLHERYLHQYAVYAPRRRLTDQSTVAATELQAILREGTQNAATLT
jgi:hypothetical protein